MSGQLETLRRYLQSVPPPPSAAAEEIVVLAAGRGGVGVSTAAAALALAAAAAGDAVLLIDAGWHLSVLALMLDVSAGPGLAALQGGGSDPEQLVVSVAAPATAGSGTLDLVSLAGDEPLPVAALDPTQRRVLLRRVSDLFGRFDRVFIDAGAGLDALLEALGLGVGTLLVVSGVDPVSQAASHAVLKVASKRRPTVVPMLLFCGSHVDVAAAAGTRLQEGAARHLGRDVAILGLIPEEPALSAATADVAVLPGLPPDSPFLESARVLAQRLPRRGGRPKALALATPQQGWNP